MILLAYPMKDGQTGKAILDAYCKLGYDVSVVDANREPDRLYEAYKKCDDVELILISRTFDLYGDISKIKMENPNTKIAMWNTDMRENVKRWGDLVQLVMFVDYYFGPANIGEWKNYQPNSYFLSQGIQTEKYHMPPQPPDKKYDVGFIGNCYAHIHKERVGILAELLASDIDFHWYTDVWDSEHNYAVSECRINLSASAYPQKKGWSVRVWKIIAAGGIVLELDRPGVKDYFNGCIETYKGADDCVDTCKRMLDDIETWERKAYELHEWAIENHTYVNRVKKIMEVVS